MVYIVYKITTDHIDRGMLECDPVLMDAVHAIITTIGFTGDM